jgi:hypothetical protein
MAAMMRLATATQSSASASLPAQAKKVCSRPTLVARQRLALNSNGFPCSVVRSAVDAGPRVTVNTGAAAALVL